MNKIVLDKKEIYEYQQNREPYLLIDFGSNRFDAKGLSSYEPEVTGQSVINPL